MQISNWTQFATTFGDTSERENGPFLDGAYLAHAVYGFFHNGGTLCWVVRVGGSEDSPVAEAALPAASDASIEAFRVLALEGVEVEPKLELTEETTPGSEASAQGGEQSSEGKSGEAEETSGKSSEGGDEKSGGAEPTYKLVVTAGTQHEEHTGLSLKKGRGYIATKVNAASKLIKIEDTGASLPPRSAHRPRAPTSWRCPPSRATRSRPRTSRATSAGGLAWEASPRSTRSRWCACPTS